MATDLSENLGVPLWCRIFGHKWEASHVGRYLNGKPVWVYVDHICTRCYRLEKRLQDPKGFVCD